MSRLLAPLLLVSLLGCANDKSTPRPLKMPPASPGTVAAAPTAPTAPAAAPTPPAGALTGKVLERIDAPPYSYLRIATASGEQWAAVNQTESKAGDQVTVGEAVVMKDFESKTLGRKFDSITFGTLVSGGAAPASPHAGIEGSHASGASGHTTVAAAGDVKVDKATGAGAVTIAELFAGRAKLKDQQVTVRGKVVKVNNGIMNKNWIHLQDGTGSEASADHDITVTTSAETKLGDVITVTGAVHLDRDFGAGYAYPVIIEDARLL